VTGKREENGQNLVDVTLRMINQRGDETVRCTAVIALPGGGKPVLYPPVPTDLAERAVKMMSRHWELSGGR